MDSLPTKLEKLIEMREQFVQNHQRLISDLDQLIATVSKISNTREEQAGIAKEAEEQGDDSRWILRKYASPSYESSVAKGIPIKYIDVIQKCYKGRFVYRYRGPSQKGYKRPQGSIRKEFAKTFALYNK